jgi:hypothetical protein
MSKSIDEVLNECYQDYNILGDDEYKSDFWDDLTEKETYNVNALHLKYNANPKFDYLTCWEPGRFDDDEEVTDLDTMYDVDYRWWKFQKEASWESIQETIKWMEKNPKKTTPSYVAKSINRYNETYDKGYSIYMTGDWYRLIENDVFLYSQFIGASWYLYYEAERTIDDLQQENIPYIFREDDLILSLNEDDPKKRYDAGGREYELESYQDAIRDYQHEVLIEKIDTLIRKYSRVFAGKTFRKDKGYESDNFDPFTDFIFFDEDSLKKVSPRNFLKTFKSCQVSFVEFQKIIDELEEIVTADFNRIYNENKSRYVSG